MKNIIGQRYGKLVVLSASHQNKEKRWLWLCKCDCGNIKTYPNNTLDYGKRMSCGCEANRKPGLKHGMRYTKEYRTWHGIKDRCLRKNSKDFSRYGGKGIDISREWEKSFENFFKDIGFAPSPKHQIERINTLRGYSKDNCLWATAKQNSCNRTSSKIWIIKNEKFESAEDAAKFFNVSDVTIHRWCKGGNGTLKKPDCNCYRRYSL